MQPNFGQIINDAKIHLGDYSGTKYKNGILMDAARLALDELVSVFVNNQLPDVKLIKLYSLPANTPELDPAAVGFDNFNAIELLEEQAQGNQFYTPVVQADVLPQVAGTSVSNFLGVYTLRQGKMQFNPIPVIEPLRATFLASGNAYAADETTAIAIDDSKAFLGYATAAKAGPSKGDTQEADRAYGMAYGQGNRDPLNDLGGALYQLVLSRLRATQQSQIQMPRYRAGGGWGYGTWFWPY